MLYNKYQGYLTSTTVFDKIYIGIFQKNHVQN